MAKATRNRTIDTSIAEGQHFLDNCITVKEPCLLSDIIDKTIIGDTFFVLQQIPQNSIDLIIADPPYNLEKNFHGNKFKRMKNSDYEQYVESWISL